MGLLNRFAPRGQGERKTRNESPNSSDVDKADKHNDGEKFHLRIFRPRILAMLLIVSLGGLIFGYDTGQISGFVAMPNFLNSFADQTDSNGQPAFSNTREGTIVGLLSIGTLVGAISNGFLADWIGRRLAIVFWNIIFTVGVIIQITTTTEWYQIVIGRLVAGFGVGGLSVLTPMYQSETAPRQIRGALVSAYQLFITFGIFLAYCINFGTENNRNRSSWQIPMGIGFIFPVLMSVGIMFLRESPRWDYRKGRVERALGTIAISYGVPQDHPEVQREYNEIREKFEAESVGGKHPWYEIFTGPRMAYRTLLGITLQSLQQLTGANYYFYYGTTIFQSVGLENPFVTSMILGGVNFGSTFLGLYVVENFGRRKSLIAGGLWMFMTFLVFASVGNSLLAEGKEPQTAGYVMIVFACLFIFGYAITWGPIIWALVGEIYPSRYRAKAMGIATSANWIWNFLISFFTPYITSSIGFRYGYVFAAGCLAGAVVVFFFVEESQGRTLEAIDTMYVLEVKPWESSKWQPTEGEMTGETDRAFLTPGGRGISKSEEGRGGQGATETEDAVVR